MLAQNTFGAFFSIGSRALARKLASAQFQVTAVIFTIMYGLVTPIALLHGQVQVHDLYHWLGNFILGGWRLGSTPLPFTSFIAT